MSRARKPKPPPSMKPWPCVILAVDTATNSGWSVWRDGSLLKSGEQRVDDALAYIDVAHICRDALSYCPEGTGNGLGVLVLERPWGGGWKATAGLAIAAKMWRDGWEAAGGSARRVVRVYPATWRSAVLGKARRGKHDTEDAIRQAESTVAVALKANAGIGHRVANGTFAAVYADEAAAICIGKWATHAGEVGKVLPAKIRKAAA